MEYIVDGKTVRYNPFHMKESLFLGSGEEGSCYKIGPYAVKFYSLFCSKMRLKKETALSMTQIETERILLPRKLLLNKRHQMQGYYTSYVEELGKDSFYQLNRERLQEEFQKLSSDLDVLASSNVLLGDLILKNTVFHEGIYLVDPGSYSFSLEALGKNEDTFNEYLEWHILAKRARFFCNELYPAKFMSFFQEERKVASYSSTLTYLQDTMKEENLDTYLKKKIKKYTR